MKIDTNYFIESREEHLQEIKKPSKGFLKALKAQVLGPMEKSLSLFFPTKPLKLVQFGVMSFENIEGKVIGIYDGYDVTFGGYQLFRFTLKWTSLRDGNKVTPFDDIKESEIAFWIDGYPDESRLKQIADRNKIDIDRYLAKENRYNEYRFQFVLESIGETVKLIFSTEEDPENIVKFIGDSVNEWNYISPNALIHNYFQEDIAPGKITISFNWGSATEDTLRFILNKLNLSSLNITKIVLDS